MSLQTIFGHNSHITIAGKNPKHKSAGQLVGILEMIAVCDSRINIETEYALKTFGRNSEGKIKCNDWEYERVMKYTAIKERLKKYYNYKLGLMKPY